MEITVCSGNHNDHINTPCGQMLFLLMLKLAVPVRTEADGTVSGSCPVAGFHIISVDPSGSADKESVN